MKIKKVISPPNFPYKPPIWQTATLILLIKDFNLLHDGLVAHIILAYGWIILISIAWIIYIANLFTVKEHLIDIFDGGDLSAAQWEVAKIKREKYEKEKKKLDDEYLAQKMYK